jgi:hypothetical protein
MTERINSSGSGQIISIVHRRLPTVPSSTASARFQVLKCFPRSLRRRDANSSSGWLSWTAAGLRLAFNDISSRTVDHAPCVRKQRSRLITSPSLVCSAGKSGWGCFERQVTTISRRWAPWPLSTGGCQLGSACTSPTARVLTLCSRWSFGCCGWNETCGCSKPRRRGSCASLFEMMVVSGSWPTTGTLKSLFTRGLMSAVFLLCCCLFSCSCCFRFRFSVAVLLPCLSGLYDCFLPFLMKYASRCVP